MKTSSKQMNVKIKNQVYHIFYQVINDCKGDIEVEQVMTALMSETEVLAVAKRLAIAVFLDKGHSYEHIKEVLKVSSATIASVAETMNERGMQSALQKVKADEWAEVWSAKISKALEKLLK